MLAKANGDALPSHSFTCSEIQSIDQSQVRICRRKATCGMTSAIPEPRFNLLRSDFTSENGASPRPSSPTHSSQDGEQSLHSMLPSDPLLNSDFSISTLIPKCASWSIVGTSRSSTKVQLSKK